MVWYQDWDEELRRTPPSSPVNHGRELGDSMGCAFRNQELDFEHGINHSDSTSMTHNSNPASAMYSIGSLEPVAELNPEQVELPWSFMDRASERIEQATYAMDADITEKIERCQYIEFQIPAPSGNQYTPGYLSPPSGLRATEALRATQIPEEHLQSAPVIPTCFNCGELGHNSRDCTKYPKCQADGHNVRDCTICTKCGEQDHNVRDCTFGLPKFDMFMDLAPELRDRIYAFALVSDRAILPHLCDHDLKFHDDNQQHHGATNRLLGITKVSKQVRDEALPIFYSANTFQVGNDTVTYFDRLRHLGRFQMIRHVQFDIVMRKEMRAAGILRGMNQYIKEANAYEKQLLDVQSTGDLHDTHASTQHANCSPAPPSSNLTGSTYKSLTDHPQYHAGGIEELNTLIALRKLTSAFTPTATPSFSRYPTYTSKLVLPVPRASLFTQYDSLNWFPTVCYGLGIQLHLVENVPVDYSGEGFITVTWHQKYQKKDFTIPIDTSFFSATSSSTGSGLSTRLPHDVGGVLEGQTEVYKRALEMFPDLEKMARPKQTTYYRRNCQQDDIRWYTVPTEGGGV